MSLILNVCVRGVIMFRFADVFGCFDCAGVSLKQAIMRFNRGMKVEVLTKKKVPSGVWRCAEIVADNGESYTVRHYRRPGVLSDVVEKVSVEAVRPCPPRGNDLVIWAVGDIVEVLDSGYWKTAEIQQVMDGGYYHIHLIGSIDEFRVEKSSIRARQEWLDNGWVLIEKVSL